MPVVSPGNSKLGKLPNVSLVPVRDCTNCKACAKECYALKALKAWPSVKQSWTTNSDLLRADPDKYFREVAFYLAKHSPRFFRIHVAGDFISRRHLAGWLRIARAFPNTRFLAFTKSFAFLPAHKSLPDNVSLVVSLFPSMKAPRHAGYSIAYAGDPMDYKGRHRARALAAIDCPGNCENCGACWSLARHVLDVVFPMH